MSRLSHSDETVALIAKSSNAEKLLFLLLRFTQCKA
jgi:hypothetical protein